MAVSNIRTIYQNGLQNVAGVVSPVYGSGVDTIAQGNDDRFSTTRVVRVKQNPGAGEFSDIAAAMASITDASPSNKYVIKVAPMTIVLSAPLVVKTGVKVLGSGSATIITTSDPNLDLIHLEQGSEIESCFLTGSTGIGACLTKVLQGTFVGSIAITNLIFGNCANVLKMNSNGNAEAMFALLRSCSFSTGAMVSEIGFEVSGSSTELATLYLESCTGFLVGPGNNQDTMLRASGTNSQLFLKDCLFSAAQGASGGNGILIENDASLIGVSFALDGFDIGVSLPNNGSAQTLLQLQSLSIINSSTNSILINKTDVAGFINGSFPLNSTSINATASASLAVFHTDPTSTASMVAVGEIFQGNIESDVISLSKLVRNTSNMGLISGGEITQGAGAFDIDIAAGLGYVRDNDGAVREISWDGTTVTIGADSSRYLTVNEASTVQLEASLPSDYSRRIILGLVTSGDVGNITLQNTPLNTSSYGGMVEKFLRKALGAVFVSGGIIFENAITDRGLDASPGEYFYGTTNFNVPSASLINFSLVRRDGSGGYTPNLNQTVVPNDIYDDGSGTPVAVTTTNFVKHTVYILPESGGNFSYDVLLGQAQYLTLGEAIDAPVATLPPQISEAAFTVAYVITQEGQPNFAKMLDARPTLRNALSVSTSPISNHGSLLGLQDDDHPQYLKTDGTRAPTGNLNMGGFTLTNVGTLPGTTTAAPASQSPDQNNAEGVSTHKARADHVHSIPTDTAVTLNANSTNARGNATAFARSDHTHNIPTATAVGLNASSANGAGTSTSFSRADHTHAIEKAAPVSQIPAQANSEGSSNAFARADHVHNIPVATPVTISSANSAGSAETFSRSDHVHSHGALGGGSQHAAAVPSVSAVGGSNGFIRATDQEKLDGIEVSATNTPLSDAAPLNVTKAVASKGTSPNVSRADHKHDIATASAVSLAPDVGNAEGNSTSLARANHTHNIPTAAAVGLNANSTNTKGAAASFARSNHTHEIATGTPASQIPAQANAQGSSVNLAKADHIHNIPVAAPGASLSAVTTNTEGTAESFSRSDHSHNITVGIPASQSPDQANAEGTSSEIARSDHVHSIPTAIAVGLNANTSNAQGVASSFARSNHTHAIASGPAATQTPNQANATGSSTNFARADHVHNIPAGTPPAVGTTNQEGVAAAFARQDHIHSHGNQAGGLLHALVVPSVDSVGGSSGFMSAPDKEKLNRLDVGAASYSNSAVFQNATATFIAIPIVTDRESFLNGRFTKVSTTEIRADFNGALTFSYKVFAYPGNNGRAFQVAIYRNGIQLPWTFSNVTGDNNPTRGNTASMSGEINVSNGDLITVRLASPELSTITVPVDGGFLSAKVYRIA